MPALYLRESDVDQLIRMPEVIEVMDDAFRQLARGKAQNVPRVRAQAPGIVLHSMSATAEWLGRVGWKQYTTSRSGAVFHVGLYESSGALLAILEANRLGQLRTGAVTGLATRLLSAPDADAVGLFGAGWQAATQLEAVIAVRPIRRARIYCRTESSRRAFAEAMAKRFQIHVAPVDTPRDAAAGMPIVVTATTSRDPVLEADWLSPGAFVAAVGSNWPHKAEIDPQTVRLAARVVCDSVACCHAEAGDLLRAAAQRMFSWEDAIELADVAAGNRAGRSDSQEILIFKSVGMALEDVALANRLHQRAIEHGVGERLPF